MAAQTAGIQQLLVAEKRAAEKITEARKRKAKRLKQAKEEAQAEVEKYKAEREAAFKEYERAHLGNKEDISARIEADTNAQLVAMTRSVAANKDKVTFIRGKLGVEGGKVQGKAKEAIQRVIMDLIKLVTKIEPKVHQNLRD